MQNASSKFRISYGLPFFLIFALCVLDFAPRGAFAGSSPNFRIEIFYAKENKEIDTTQSSTTTLTNPNNSSLDINLPADVLTSGDAIELVAYSTPKEAVTSDNPLPSGKLVGNIFYNISFKKLSDNSLVSFFDKPITLTFSYTDSDINGIDESTLKIYRWNGSAWSILSDSSVDTSLNKITATTQQFSNFGLLGNPSPVCGNGVVESGEQCDAGESNGVCPAACSTSCTANSCGGGDNDYVAPETSVVFSGRAYPKSAVTLLKDAQTAATTIAGADANFSIGISGLSGGNYIFSVYSEDNKGIRSSLLTFSVGVTSGATTQVSGIFIAPTIAVDKNEVKQGDNIAFFGQSAPESEITISVSSEEEFFNKINTDVNGVYLYNFDTSVLEMGQHFAKSKAMLNGEISSFSKAISFMVGAKTVPATPEKCRKSDLNCDARVNLVDFSIAAYWYKRPLSETFKLIEVERLNGDGKIDLIDFSIMAFYWTG